MFHVCIRRPWAAALFLCQGALSSACSTAAAVGHCRVTVQIEAKERVNVDRHGLSLPTTVRLIQLKDVAVFKGAGFEDLWTKAPQVLGEDLVATNEVAVYPGEIRDDIVVVKEDANYLAAVAIFREPDGTYWRTAVRLPPAATVARCAEGKPGGPYYLTLYDSRMTSEEPKALAKVKPKPKKRSPPPKARKTDDDEDDSRARSKDEEGSSDDQDDDSIQSEAKKKVKTKIPKWPQ